MSIGGYRLQVNYITSCHVIRVNKIHFFVGSKIQLDTSRSTERVTDREWEGSRGLYEVKNERVE